MSRFIEDIVILDCQVSEISNSLPRDIQIFQFASFLNAAMNQIDSIFICFMKFIKFSSFVI